MELEMRSVVVKTFPAATQTIAAEHFAADSVVAARLGYAATSQSWDGEKLTVIYQLQPSGEGDPSATRAESNAQANQARANANAMANQARAEANAQSNQERANARDPDGLPPPPPVPPR